MPRARTTARAPRTASTASTIRSTLPRNSSGIRPTPDHPGFEEDLFVRAHPIDLYRLVVGQQSLAQVMDEGLVQVDGPSTLVRSLPRWFLLRAFGPEIADGPQTERHTRVARPRSRELTHST